MPATLPAGRRPVIATDNPADLLALDLDCLVYQGNYSHREGECVADVIPFLEAGVNVVGPALMDLIAPDFGRKEFVEPIARACEKGHSSIFCGGTDPGYMTIGYLFSLLSGAGAVDCVDVCEIANLNGYSSFLSIVNWGFNQPLDYRAPMFYDDIGKGWHESTIWGIAQYLGVELDEIVQTYETAALDHDYDAACGRGLAGTIAAIRWTMKGMHQGKPLIIYRKVERCHTDAGPAIGVRHRRARR